MATQGRKHKFISQHQKDKEPDAQDVELRLHPVQRAFFDCEKIYKAFVGGVGCVAPETMIGDCPIAEITTSHVVKTLSGSALATPAHSCGKADLYRIVTKQGNSINVTLEHRFLTHNGWRRLKSLRVGSQIAAEGQPRWRTIKSIDFIRNGEYYDLHVPGLNHYAAHGLYNHNSGKALALNTPIPTPMGWTTIGEIAIGDIVFDEHGKQCRVVNATEVMYNRPCCEITFCDGTTVIADENHEWPTLTQLERKSKLKNPKSHVNRTTREIAETILYCGITNHGIRNCQPIECDAHPLPIAPYTLGTWLGDGTSTSANITNADNELLHAINQDGYETRIVPSQKKGLTNTYVICVPGLYGAQRDHATGKFNSHPDQIISVLRSLGVIGHRSENKTIPTAYLRATIEQRKELLRGLMDTDGSVDDDGSCEYCTTTQSLAETFVELCFSLGLKARLRKRKSFFNGKECKPRYRIYFTPFWPVCKLSRKEEKLRKPNWKTSRTNFRYIKSIKRIDSVPVRCIQVDSPNHLYLCTKSFIPTHNSFVGACDILAHSEPGDLVAVISPTFRMLSDSTIRSFIEVAEKFGLWDEDKYRKTDNQAVLKNGVEVLFRSGDEPDRLRGPSLRRAWLDEAGLMNESVFNVAVGRLRQYGKQGYLSATFTPQGRSSWTYRLFHDDTNQNVALFHCSTKDNPFLDPAFYQNLLLQYGKGDGGRLRAEQELDGLFVNVAGSEFGSECFGPSIWFDKWPTTSDCIKFAALDSSKGKGGKTGDYSAFVMMMAAEDLLWVDFDMDNTRNISGITQRLIEVQQIFQPEFFGIEQAFGAEILADCIEKEIAHLPPSFTLTFNPVLVPTKNLEKPVRIRRLTPFLTNGIFRFKRSPGSRIAVAQLEDFPNGLHDDSGDVLDMVRQVAKEAGLFVNGYGSMPPLLNQPD